MARSNLGENEARGWSLGGVPDYVPPPPGPRPWLTELNQKVMERRNEREIQRQAGATREAGTCIIPPSGLGNGHARSNRHHSDQSPDMSLRNLTRQQLDEDYYWGDAETRDSVSAERRRREIEAEERVCRAEDERKDA